jgi:hypothetical protein
MNFLLAFLGCGVGRRGQRNGHNQDDRESMDFHVSYPPAGPIAMIRPMGSSSKHPFPAAIPS